MPSSDLHLITQLGLGCAPAIRASWMVFIQSCSLIIMGLLVFVLKNNMIILQRASKIVKY